MHTLPSASRRRATPSPAQLCLHMRSPSQHLGLPHHASPSTCLLLPSVFRLPSVTHFQENLSTRKELVQALEGFLWH